VVASRAEGRRVRRMVLTGKSAVVTGAASGFGRAIAHRFAAEGASVVIADLAHDVGAAVADEIRERGGRAVSIRTDVTVADDVRSMVETAVSVFGSLDVLVNNAGVAQANTPLSDTKEDLFERVVAVNLRGVFLGMRYALPLLIEQSRGGVILNLSSGLALRPLPGFAAYAAAKAAVIALTKTAALEVARHGIRINALCPAAGDTPMLAEIFGGPVGSEVKSALVGAVPLGRLAQPSDVAACAAFLASDAGSYLTGVALPVDGGRMI
jgi:NAD(P)-dependent dehydrogenase (short-subunit alcohol dehydrogenase family)